MIKVLKRIFIGIVAVAVLVTVLILLWWYGAFIPSWVKWKEFSTDYADGYVVLKNRNVTLYSDDTCTTPLWSTQRDWFVQDVVIKDLDHDGAEEIIMLVWKHGSYGNHRPFWVEKNDVRLTQHVFIYSYNLKKESRLQARWMSSELDFEIDSIANGKTDKLILTIRGYGSQYWMWRNFGIKAVADTKPSEIKLLCAGDNLIHLSLLREDQTGANLYERISDTIQEADIAAINLETMLVDDDGAVSDYPKFGTPIGVGEALVDAGFDVFNLANNHVLDKGKYGVDTTTGFCKENEIAYCGASSTDGYTGDYRDSIAFVESEGIRIAFLGYTYGTNHIACPKDYPYMVEKFSDKERMIKQLDHARARADVVVVYAHWGEEYETQPNEEQLELAKLMAEHKVDVIIGAHPHVLQEYDVIKDPKSKHETIVYYSLGNFISGQNKEGTKEGGIAEISIFKDANGDVKITDHSMRRIKTVSEDKKYRVEED